MQPKFVNNTTNTTSFANSPSLNANNTEIARQLGSDWFTRQQNAANTGDWDTYFAMQAKIDQILNPVIDRF
jgi:hypothetical protein